MTVKSPLEAEIARLVVEAVNLETPAEALDPEAPLYGEGLGLDSIDMLEISLAIGKQYGVELRADDEANRDHLRQPAQPRTPRWRAPQEVRGGGPLRRLGPGR